MALLAVSRLSQTTLLVRSLQLPAEQPSISTACSVHCLRTSSALPSPGRMRRGVRVESLLQRSVHSFHSAIGAQWRRSNRKGLVWMAMNDNQGSSGEDMLHAEEDFSEATVMDAVSMPPEDNNLTMREANGTVVKLLRRPRAGRLYYQASVPTIFLKMEASDLVLPIVVNDQARLMLMQALRKETGARPTMYEVVREMCTATGMEVRMVRVTGRVVDTYHARIYLAKPGSDELVSVDAKPSDAINVAVSSNAKIFVNRHLMETDGVIPEYKTVWTEFAGHGFARLLPDAKLDVADNQQDPLAEEIVLIKNMSAAAHEERYADAARWRDELQKFRTKNKSRRLHRQV